MTVQFKNTFDGTECFGIDFVHNENRPYFGAAFTDGSVKIWSLADLTGADAGATLDKPKFEIQDAVSLGPVDLKFNSLGNRVAVSSMDGSLRVFNLRESDSVMQDASG